MGTKRADVVGYTPGGLFGSPRVVTVELKNDLAQMSRGLDQMTTYDEFSTAVYLACTPRLAADFLKKHAASPGVRRWEPDALDRKLEKFGFGLLLVEGEEVTEVRSARTSSIDAKRLEQLQANLAK